MSNWIKLHRQILDNAFCYRDMERLGLWTYLLVRANREQREFYIGRQKVICQPGQVVTGRKSLAQETGLHESKIERYLNVLEIEQQIEQQMNSKFRIITIKNWGDYQCPEQQMNSNRTASEQQVNTNKKVKTVRTVRSVKLDTVVDCDSVVVAQSAPTPAKKAELFFAKDSQTVKNEADYWLAQGVPVEIARIEFAKFMNYWTEKNKSGTKCRWQLQKTFEVRLRLSTWFTKVASDYEKKSGTLTMPDFRTPNA